MRLIHRHSCEYSRGLLLIAGNVVAYEPDIMLRAVFAQSPMHQRSVPLSCHPHGRTSPATRTRVGEHASIRPCPAAKKEGGSIVRGVEEPDRTAAFAPAETKVRAGAV